MGFWGILVVVCWFASASCSELDTSTLDPNTSPIVDSREEAPKGLLDDPQRLGQVLIGGLLGLGMGTMTGSTTMGSSGEVPEAQDAVANMYAGIAGGLLSSYRMKKPEMPREGLKISKEERITLAQAGFKDGMVAGGVAGAFGQVFSGSSDQGGSSVSSASSSSAVNQNTPNTPGDHALTGRSSLAEVAGKMPIIHTALSGGAAGAMVGYFEPEIVLLGGAVGNAAVSSAKEMHKHAQTVAAGSVEKAKEMAEHAKLVAEDVKQIHTKFQAERAARLEREAQKKIEAGGRGSTEH